MKLIGTLQGICFLKFSPEEIAPRGGILAPAITNLMRTAYQARPAVVMRVGQPINTNQIIPALAFANGQFSLNDETVSIVQIAFADQGLTVASKTTDDAGKIMDHLVNTLDENLGFKIAQAETRRQYVSVAVVQFERSLLETIEPMNKIKKIIAEAIKKPVDLKRLAIGPKGNSGPFITIETVDEADFVLEARVGHEFSENRYFSTAPMTTDAHVAILTQIEAAIPGAV